MPPSPLEGQAGAAKKSAKAYSCIRCFERKVKCDKESPACSNCMKSSVECIYRVPPAPRRRKKRTQQEILESRLNHYEDILRSKGIDVHKDGVRPQDLPPTAIAGALGRSTTGESASTDSTDTVNHEDRPDKTVSQYMQPKLIVDQGRTLFVESNLWTSVAEEFRKPSDAMREDSDEDDDETIAGDNIEYVLGTTPSSMGVRDLHPLPEQVFTLWQIFLDHVNPLSKLVHVPSMQPVVIEASSHLDKLPKNLEALLFAIYTTAVLSLDAEECQTMLGESRTVLLSRYRSGTKRALARAKFLGTSDLLVLQAFVLHLLAMRDVYDAKTLWTLTGVGNRIAEGMGIHKDGSTLGLGPFETELRRRLWWQLVFLDFRTAELSGSGQPGPLAWDVRIPTNINDEDIWPNMKEDPEPKERATEMIFCLTRYEVGNFWTRKLLSKTPTGNYGHLWENFRRLGAIDEKEKAIEELERTLEHKYVRYCDPSNPVEFLAILVTRAATNGMRLMAHHPRRYGENEEVPESERKLLWTIATKLLDMSNMLHSSKPMQRFRWHTDSYFQWQALIYALTWLRDRPLFDGVDHGWQLINQIFEHHPVFIEGPKTPIHFAVGSLCLKAWKAREDMWAQKQLSIPLVTPGYITKLRQDRQEKKTMLTPTQQQPQSDYFFKHQQTQKTINMNHSQLADLSLTEATSLPQVTSHIETYEPLAQQYTYQPQLQQQNLPSQLPFPQQDTTQQMFWWEFARSDPTMLSSAMDFSVQPSLEQMTGEVLEPMDWTQWDLLINRTRPTG